MRKAILALGFIPLLVTACATSPYPNPGFYETRIEDNRFRVVYRAEPGVPRHRAEDLALLRAADLALENGYDWFQVISRDATANPSNGPVISLGTGGANYGRSSSVGVGVGTSFQLGSGYDLLTMEVMMGRGPAPDERAYNAADVARTLRSSL